MGLVQSQSRKTKLGPWKCPLKCRKHLQIPDSERTGIIIAGSPTFDAIDVIRFIMDLELGCIRLQAANDGAHLGEKVAWAWSRVTVDSVIVQSHDELQVRILLAQPLVHAGVGERHGLQGLNPRVLDQFMVAFRKEQCIASVKPYPGSMFRHVASLSTLISK